MKYLLTNQETERLIFRKLQQVDFEIWLELFEDDLTARMLGMEEFQTPIERCDKWFDWTFHRYEHDLGGQNVLVFKETNEIVGQCGLLVRKIEDKIELEIAYSVLPDHRGNGFAAEAARKCRNFAFENKFHDRLLSLIVPENLSSEKVAVRNGMTLNREIIYNSKQMNLFQITRDDWELR